jgi:hypothetical protein
MSKAGNHAHGKYSVTIATDGAIKVKSGDWLSKYSAAIHNGDTSKVHEYGRLKTGKVEKITNVDKISAGETIYHVPTYWAYKGATAPKVDSNTNVWLGLGVDVQYTLGVAGQQIMVATLRSVDNPKRVAILFVENYKFGLSVDLTASAYFTLATGLKNPVQLNKENSSEKLEWDFTLAIGLKWSQLFKAGKAAKKVEKANISAVVSTGTRMAKKKVGPALKKLMETVSNDLRRGRMTKKERLLEIMKRATETSPDDVAELVQGTRTALSALEIDFESAVPKFHNFALLGAGVGLGITRNFGTIHVLHVEG